jgi:flagellar FliL protein
MADKESTDEAAVEGEDGAKKKKLSGKVLVLFVALPLLLIGGSGGAVFMFMSGGAEPAQAAAKEHAPKGDQDEGHSEGEPDAHGADEGGDGNGEKKEEGGHGDGNEEAASPEEVGRVNYAASDLIFYELPDMIVNLNTTGSQPRFLRIRVALEFGDKQIVKKIRRDMPRIIDHFQVYLRELRREDLRGSAGMYRLKEELMIRVNQTVQPSRIRDVLFREMLVQ